MGPVLLSPDDAYFICAARGRDSCSASGMGPRGRRHQGQLSIQPPGRLRGALFDSPVSSLTAETVALDDCIAYLTQFICPSNFAKRARLVQLYFMIVGLSLYVT